MGTLFGIYLCKSSYRCFHTAWVQFYGTLYQLEPSKWKFPNNHKLTGHFVKYMCSLLLKYSDKVERIGYCVNKVTTGKKHEVTPPVWESFKIPSRHVLNNCSALNDNLLLFFLENSSIIMLNETYFFSIKNPKSININWTAGHQVFPTSLYTSHFQIEFRTKIAFQTIDVISCILIIGPPLKMWFLMRKYVEKKTSL